MSDYRQIVNDHSCQENQGCGTATMCMCALAEDMADEIERLRAGLARLIGSYEEYVRQQYPAGSFKYPAVMRKYEADMEPAQRAREILGDGNE